MKLFVFLGSLTGGGAERVAVILAEGFAKRGAEVTVATLASEKEDFYPLDTSVKRIVVGGSTDSKNIFQTLWISISRLRALRRILRETSPDWILAHMTQTNIIAIIANLGLKTKIAVVEHNYPPHTVQGPRGRLWELLRRFTYPKADVVVALTKKSEDWLLEHYPKVKTAVIPNPISWPFPNFPPVRKPKDYVADGKHILLASGHFSVKKGFDLLIPAFSHIYKKHPDWQLVILGDGQEQGNLERMIREHDLDDAVVMPGRVGNIGDWYRRADLFVLSSRLEGFPMVILEAMASGLPVVSFDCDTGPRDIIRPGIDGFLVPPGDIAALAETLSKVMADDDLRRRLAGRAVEVKERFSVDNIINNWENVLRA